jgi:hypothetical protein
MKDARKHLQHLMAFIKTFNRRQWVSVYCEREWRSTAPFCFRPADIAMVAIPRAIGRVSFYRPFVDRVAKRLQLPRHVSILAWEDLIEH